MNENLNKIVESWIKMYKFKEGSEEYKNNFWVFEEMFNLFDKNPEKFFIIIEQIVKKSDEEIVLANLAAGHLEDLLTRYGELFIDRIEDLARKDAKFRKLLGVVWQSSMSDDIWKRIRKFADKSW